MASWKKQKLKKDKGRGKKQTMPDRSTMDVERELCFFKKRETKIFGISFWV